MFNADRNSLRPPKSTEMIRSEPGTAPGNMRGDLEIATFRILTYFSGFRLRSEAVGNTDMQKRFIDDHEAEQISGIKRSTLQKKRMRGEGPPAYKIGRSKTAPVRYDLDEFLVWMKSQPCGGEAQA